MSMQHVFGTSILTLAFAGVFNALGMATSQETYIEVHSLVYTEVNGAPYIIQNRTVQVDGNVLVGKWETGVYIIEGTSLRLVCEGGDGSDYEEGFLAHAMPFDYWVGEDGCFDKIPDKAKVKLYAKHSWGEGEFKDKWSDQFVVDKSVFQ